MIDFMVWYCGMVLWYGIVVWYCGMVWYGMAWHGMAWHGMAWREAMPSEPRKVKVSVFPAN